MLVCFRLAYNKNIRRKERKAKADKNQHVLLFDIVKIKTACKRTIKSVYKKSYQVVRRYLQYDARGLFMQVKQHKKGGKICCSESIAQ